MTDFIATLDATLTALAAADPQLRRFGAARHGYRRAPVIGEPARELPDDYRDYLVHVAGGGVGPYYGLVRADRCAPIAAPAGVTAWTRARPIAHVGCGYVALLVLDGAARGEVWLDARVLGFVIPIRASFTAYMLDWIDRLAHNRWPESFVPPNRCALATALSGYLAVHEGRLGLPEGSISGADLEAALGLLGSESIVVAAEDSSLFAPDDPVDPCVSCARLLDNLAVHGLARDVVRPGAVPVPDRT